MQQVSSSRNSFFQGTPLKEAAPGGADTSHSTDTGHFKTQKVSAPPERSSRTSEASLQRERMLKDLDPWHCLCNCINVLYVANLKEKMHTVLTTPQQQQPYNGCNRISMLSHKWTTAQAVCTWQWQIRSKVTSDPWHYSGLQNKLLVTAQVVKPSKSTLLLTKRYSTYDHRDSQTPTKGSNLCSAKPTDPAFSIQNISGSKKKITPKDLSGN